jgi:hypothetical protein
LKRELIEISSSGELGDRLTIPGLSITFALILNLF